MYIYNGIYVYIYIYRQIDIDIDIYITSSVKLKNQLKIYFKQAFDLYLGLPQALTTNVSYQTQQVQSCSFE